MNRYLPLWPATILIAIPLIAWNALPFRDRSMHVRTKDLSFVPDPVLGRMLCLGQCGAWSKLQWIDSFAYFELQLDRRNDTLAGSGQSGFQRLYDLLIGEDPDYQKFYEYAAFNTGALLSRHDIALSYLLRGLMHLPHDSSLWQQAAAELYAGFDLESSHPEQMDDFLTAWAATETDAIQRRQVWDWKAAMNRRRHLGLEQLSYWQEQLAFNQPGSSAATYIESQMRELLARYAVSELTALAAAYQARHGFAPIDLRDLLEPALIAERYRKGISEWAPIGERDQRLVLRLDPYGYPFHLLGGSVISPGLQRNFGENPLIKLRAGIDAAIGAHGRYPSSVAEVKALGVKILELPECHYHFGDHQISIAWDPPPGRPWPVK